MANEAPGKHFRKGISLIEIMRMFPDDATAEAWFVKVRCPRPACPYCGFNQRPERREAQDDALPLPREGMSQAVQRPRRNGHAGVESRLPDLGDGDLPLPDEPERRVEHEAPSRPGNHSEVGLAPCHRIRKALESSAACSPVRRG